MKKLNLLILLILFSIGCSAQSIINAPDVATKKDSLVFTDGSKAKHLPLSTLQAWVGGSGGGTDDQVLSISNDVLTLENGGSVDVSKYNTTKNLDYQVTPHFTMNAISQIVRGTSTAPKGIIDFGDSMKNIPTNYLFGALQEYGMICGGMGTVPFYNSTNDGSIGYGSSIVLNGGAVSVGINDQLTTYGQTEWINDIYVVSGTGQNVEFIFGGVHPLNSITKLYVLTEVGGGTYTIQSNTDSAGWVNVSTGNSANAPTGMVVHTFDNSANSSRIGYRILWESGIVKTIYPAIYKDTNTFISINGGVGGADFMKQTAVSSARVRFLLQDLNVVLATSSHRYEVLNSTEMQTGIDLMDAWWNGLPMDVFYLQQPPDTSVVDADIVTQNDIIRAKCKANGYITKDAYNMLGGVTGVTLGGYNSVDPVHLDDAYKDIAGALFLKEFNLNDFRGLSKSSPIIKHTKVEIVKDVSNPDNISEIGTDNFGLDLINSANRYGKLVKGGVDAPTETALLWSGKLLSVGKKIIFSYDGSNNAKIPTGNYPTLTAYSGGSSGNYVRAESHLGTGALGELRGGTDITQGESYVNVNALNTAIAGVSGGSVSDAVYDASWNGDLGGASKNAIYDKIETISGGSSWSPTIAEWNTLTATDIGTATYSYVTFDDNEFLDAGYTDTSGTTKTIVNAGRYRVYARVTINNTAYANLRYTGEMTVEIDGVNVDTTRGAYVRVLAGSEDDNLSIDGIYTFKAGDQLKIKIKRLSDNATTVNTVVGMCKLIIEKR